MVREAQGATVSDLPLLELFYRLREAELPLGIEEYELLPRAMMAGFGFEGVESLKRLCRLLWIKSAEEEIVFEHVFAEFLQGRQPVGDETGTQEEVDAAETATGELPTPKPDVKGSVQGEEKGKPAPSPDPGGGMKKPTPERDLSTRPPEADSARPEVSRVKRPDGGSLQGAKLSGKATTGIDDEATQFLLPRLGQVRSPAKERRYRFASDYLPITKRQMKQSWRYLRKAVRQGPPVELDVEATVNKVASEGRLYQPVLRPRRINRAAMVLLVDQEGSMVPFHSFSRRLEETAVRGGRLGQTDIFYFHNYPLDVLYCNPHFSESVTLEWVLGRLHPTRTAVLIFSDAGAARSRYSYDRVDKTRTFLRRLYQAVRYVAWLNPMPTSRWANTSAAAIARSTPMFDVSRQGMHNAISVLRGRTIPRR